MFRLNLKIAWRNVWRNKISSMINLIGLAIGLASCLLLLLYVNYEWRFDKQFKDAGQVYQVLTNFQDANGKISSTGDATGNNIAGFLQEKIPGVKAVSRIGFGGQALIANQETVISGKQSLQILVFCRFITISLSREIPKRP